MHCHDRIVAVRPLVELDDLVPVLGLVDRLIRIEPHRVLEHEVRALVRPLHAALDLERRAAPEHAARRAALTAGRLLPGARQVRLAARQPRRRHLLQFGERDLRPAAAKAATRRLRLQRCHCKTEQHAQGGHEPRPDDLLFPHEPNPLLNDGRPLAADQIVPISACRRRSERWPARASARTPARSRSASS